ncbi:MAG: N-acetylglucosamine-6-phosphate deacetylase [Fusobacteriaceae bacterium]|jgi:N-acetylglucosamine-6-phosphate deacetylase|nr:N-acetylglucosamine-6-phosphate deacetylase [Fusobacteriaceae bacterium]
MKPLLLTNAKVIVGHQLLENGYVYVEDGKITDINNGTPNISDNNVDIVDCQMNYLSPGFIDIHTHGGGGADFMDGDEDAIITASRMHLSHGTTSIYPTTLTCSDEELFLFFKNYKKVKNITENMPHLMGIHLEGPYFSPAQCGAQPKEYMQTPNPEKYMKILELGGNDIARWSSAPEIDGALELGKELSKRGIMAAIAHSDATYDEVLSAIKSGYTHVTHLYSGMSSITRRGGFRVLGVVESAYLLDVLTVEIIADGCHLPPELLRLIVKNKHNTSICLVTDSMRGAGMPEGPSILGSKANGQEVIIEGGIAKLLDHMSFAGSVATTDRLVRVMTKNVGLSMIDAVSMMTINPARFMHIDNKKGSISIGKDGDLVVFDENVNIKKIFIMGEPVIL